MDFSQIVFIVSVLFGVIVFSMIVKITILLNKCNKRTKTYNSIEKTVTKMFHSIEKCTGSEDGQITISEIRISRLLLYIRSLKDFSIKHHDYLESDQFREFISILTKIEGRSNMITQKQLSQEAKYYEDLLKEFKNIKWLRIEIKKLDLGVE